MWNIFIIHTLCIHNYTSCNGFFTIDIYTYNEIVTLINNTLKVEYNNVHKHALYAS